jgi:hypothetical protein
VHRGNLFFNQKNEKMKTVKNFSSIGMIALLCLFVASCAKDNSSLVKSSKLAVNFSTIKGGVLKGAGSTKGSSSTNGFTLNSVKISIANLIIEENSGNDVEQQGNHNDGGNDKESKSKEGSNGENGDVLLPGPYVLDVIDGKLTIDQVDVYPGTFKKVDFSFMINNEAGFGGNSIMVSGSYQKTDGTVLPVVLKSDFNQQVQLQLANGGVIVAANSTVALSIVLDIPTWINSLDLSTAAVLNNEILIDKTNNQELLKLVESNLTSNIEVED